LYENRTSDNFAKKNGDVSEKKKKEQKKEQKGRSFRIRMRMYGEERFIGALKQIEAG